MLTPEQQARATIDQLLYEQMKGRGVRTIPTADLQAVTPDAQTKTRFILFDAVGVSESKKNASQPLERQRSISFDVLLDRIAMGSRDPDTLFLRAQCVNIDTIATCTTTRVK